MKKSPFTKSFIESRPSVNICQQVITESKKTNKVLHKFLKSPIPATPDDMEVILQKVPEKLSPEVDHIPFHPKLNKKSLNLVQ